MCEKSMQCTCGADEFCLCSQQCLVSGRTCMCASISSKSRVIFNVLHNNRYWWRHMHPHVIMSFSLPFTTTPSG